MNGKMKRTIQNYAPIALSIAAALSFGGKAKNRIQAEKVPVTISRNYSDVNDVWKNAVNNISRDEFNSYWKEIYKPAINYSVEGGSKTKSNLESKLVQGDFENQKRLYLGEYVGKTSIKRFNEFENYFSESSKKTPNGMSSEEFMALLVSVSQRESSIGYPNGGKKRSDKMLMGYGSPNRKEFFGAKKQVESAAKTLREAFDEKNPLYRKACNVDGREKARYVLSIYNQGKINGDGLKYADEVLTNYRRWVKEFSDKL